MATNAAIAAVVAAMIWLVGIGPFLLVHLPIMLLAASIGVWLFYIQHQFEHTVWAGDGAWNLREAALTAAPITPCRVLCAGSPPISAFTTSTTCAAASPIIACRSCCATIRTSPASARLTLLQSLACVRLVLWDEDRQRLVSFREARQHG